MIKNSTLSGPMRKFLKDKSSKKGVFALLFLLFGLTSQAQMTVAIDNPANASPALQGPYSSFASVLNDLNAATLTGPITITLTGSEIAPKDGLVLGSTTLNASLSSTNTITIVASGTATLNAGVGDKTPGSIGVNQDGILKLVGADYVTIDGLTFTDDNTTNPATMEYGLALYKASISDGCQYNTIKNCTFNMQSINNAAGSGTMPTGSQGILLTNALPDKPTAFLSPTLDSGTSSNNKFYHNTFNGGNMGISLTGNGSQTPADTNNDIGGSTAQNGNIFQNFGGATTGWTANTYACAVYTLYQQGLNISYNTIDNSQSGATHAGIIKGIFTDTSVGASTTITNNSIKLVSNAATAAYALCGIQNASGTSVGGTITITNNNIHDCSYLTALAPNSSPFMLGGIYNTASTSTLNIINNIISNNTIGAASKTTSTTMVGICNTASLVSQTFNANNNTISDNSLLNQTGIFYAIQAGNHKTICDGNTISGNTMPSTAGTTQCKMYLIYNSSSTASAISETYSNNTITNNSIGGTNTNTTGNQMWCIVTSSALSSTNTCSIHDNKITGNSNGTQYSNFRGIGVLNIKDANIYNNKIADYTGSGVNATATGIYTGLSSGTTNLYNNIIGDIKLPNANGGSVLAGINISNTTTGGTFNAYHNTVFLNSPNGATSFSSKCIAVSNGPTATMNNNIFVNNSVTKGASPSNIIERGDTTLNKYSVNSNNNLFYSNTGANIYKDNAASKTTLADFKSYAGATRESNSISESPAFTSITGTEATFLHLDPNVLTSIDGAGIPIASVTTDFDGNTRSATPDLGADEYEPFKKLVVNNPAAVCSPATIDLTSAAITAGSSADLTFTYWTDAAATVSFDTPAAATAGKYYIKASNAAATESAIKAVTVTVNQTPSLVITNPAAVCSPATIDITDAAVTAGSDTGLELTYWTNAGATIAYATPATASNGTYFIKSLNTNTGCFNIKPVAVTVNGTLVITDPKLCAAAPADLTNPAITSGSDPVLTYTYWSDAAATTEFTTPTAAAPGTYYIKGTNATAGCTSIKPVTVTVNAAPVVTTHNPPAFCNPGTADITASAVTAGSDAGLTYSYWTNIQATNSLATPAAAPSGYYYIKGTNPTTGCSTVRPVSVLGNDPYGFNVNTPAAVCAPNTVSITGVTQGPPTTTYTYWTDAAATVSFATPAAATNGTYYIKSTDENGCSLVKSVVVTVKAAPQLITNAPAAVCIPGTVDITLPAVTAGSDAGLTLSYWTNGSATNALVTPTAAAAGGTFYIKAINAGGCSAVKQLIVPGNDPYGFNVNTPAAVCAPNTVSILGVTQGPPTTTYTYWTDSTATASYATPSAATNGTYYIKSLDENGCSLVKSVVVTVKAAPVVTTTNPAAFCNPGTADITAPAVTAGSDAGLTYSYWTNIQATNSLATPGAAPAGYYYIKGTNPTTGCSTVRPVSVLGNDPYGFNVNTPAAVCAPNTVSITGVTQGPPTTTYTYWTDAAATASYATPAAATNGTYYIKSTDENGCSLVKPVTVTVTPTVTPTFTQVAPICYGTALPTLPTAFETTIGSWTPALNNAATTTYTFTPAAGQCANSFTMTIEVGAMVSAPTGDAAQTLVQGKTINDIVVQKDANGIVTWFDSEAHALAGTPALDPSTELVEGNYYAMQSINGCTSAAPFAVAVNVTEEIMGVSKFEMPGLRYYPNPVKDELHVSYSNEISSIEMFNLLGQHIMTVRPNAVNAKISMSGLAQGAYLLQVTSQGHSRMVKVIKE